MNNAIHITMCARAVTKERNEDLFDFFHEATLWTFVCVIDYSKIMPLHSIYF